jgi:3'(2'), 5'-bisphosphate nucleotidase
MEKRDIDLVVEIAKCAGRKILDIYQKNDFEKSSKLDNSPVTEADLMAHDIIVNKLGKLTPTIPILSEESALTPWVERKKWQKYWLIDPLDGTKEFIKRNGEFTVNIALIYKNTPILGVVHAPVLGETWVGAKGKQAYKIKNNKRLTIRTLPHKDGELWRVVGSRSHVSKSFQKYLESMGDHQLISMGSSLKFCIVAEGGAHIYPRLGNTSEWDTAAAHAVVNAAGGEVLNIDGKPLLYNTEESIRNPHFIVIG